MYTKTYVLPVFFLGNKAFQNKVCSFKKEFALEGDFFALGADPSEIGSQEATGRFASPLIVYSHHNINSKNKQAFLKTKFHTSQKSSNALLIKSGLLNYLFF